MGWHSQNLSPKADGGIVRQVIKKPDPCAIYPNDGALVSIHMKGAYRGRVFEKRDLTFYVGEITDDELISGIHTGIKCFGKGETSK